jgi:hypothetical protein
MRTMILATAAVLGLGAGAAFAGEGGVEPNTFFTQLPGVIAQAPVQQQTAIAQNRVAGSPSAAFVTSNQRGTWLFPPNANEGANN